MWNAELGRVQAPALYGSQAAYAEGSEVCQRVCASTI